MQFVVHSMIWLFFQPGKIVALRDCCNRKIVAIVAILVFRLVTVFRTSVEVPGFKIPEIITAVHRWWSLIQCQSAINYSAGNFNAGIFQNTNMCMKRFDYFSYEIFKAMESKIVLMKYNPFPLLSLLCQYIWIFLQNNLYYRDLLVFTWSVFCNSGIYRAAPFVYFIIKFVDCEQI